MRDHHSPRKTNAKTTATIAEIADAAAGSGGGAGGGGGGERKPIEAAAELEEAH